jgi:hypothetical protein
MYGAAWCAVHSCIRQTWEKRMKRIGILRDHIRFAAAIAAVLVVTVAARAQEAKLPDTSAGAVAAAYFKAFNSGERDVMRAFETEHRANADALAGSIDARLLSYKESFETWGKLTVDGVFESTDWKLSVGVVASNTDDFLRFEFELQAAPPHKLFAIAIKRGGPRPIRVRAAEAAQAAAPELDSEARDAAVLRVAKLLKALYVSAEVGEKMSDALRKSVAEGAYDAMTDPKVLADRLTEDLQNISHDKHLRIRAGQFPRETEDDAAQTRPWERAAGENYGFEKVERLPGNIGYVKLNYLSGDPAARPTAAAAMNFVKNTDALIFDLRDNGGGSPDMIVFLSDYLFDERVHLNSFYNRREDSTRHTHTSGEAPPGGRYGADKPVYVLTSSYTFSGAEEFAYNLQNLKRATIVGETSGGGAHPVERHRLNDHLAIMVPYARAINPITGTNWEGVGVVPDVGVSSADALSTSRRLAVKKLLDTEPDSRLAEERQRELTRLDSDREPASASRKDASDPAQQDH